MEGLGEQVYQNLCILNLDLGMHTLGVLAPFELCKLLILRYRRNISKSSYVMTLHLYPTMTHQLPVTLLTELNSIYIVVISA